MENNKIKRDINNVVNDNLKALEQLFPSAVKDGQLDVKALKEELGDFEEVTTEKYELNWAGKQNAKKIVQQGIGNKTLKFVAKDSKNADTTENIYIEGDNLEVLKLLRQNYYNSIKMIYIDPPYNTGNDFVYNDIFKKSNDESDKEEGYVTETGERLEKNTKSNNSRFHTNWLNMMYPRLKLARDLLTDDGVIFISIDDNEQANLKRLCDEIFGEENFVGVISNVTGASQNGEGVLLQKNIEYCLVYSKLIDRVSINKVDKANEELRNLSDAPTSLITRPDMGYTIYYNTETNDIIPVKDYNKNKILSNIQEEVYQDVKELIENGYIPIRPGIKNNQLHRWRWGFETFSERKNEIIVKKINDKFNVYFKQSGYNPPKNIQKFSVGTNELKKLFDNIKIFDYPKSVNMLKYLVSIGMNKGDLMIDFFSGSATTAHAVMQLNSEDNGNRKYIMVQLPETTDEKSESFKAGYKNIAEIGKERIRRAGEKIKQEIEEYNLNLKLGEEPKKVPDIGFKVFKVDNTNIKWYDLENFNEESQYSFDDPDSLDFVLGSNDIDIVYEIMLRQNDVPLSESLEVLTNIGNRTYFYASTYLICLETEITEEMVEKLASLDPLPIKFVFRDSAFKDNISLKDETFRKLRSLIERNSGESKVSYRVEFI